MKPISLYSLPTPFNFTPEKAPAVGQAITFAWNPAFAMAEAWTKAVQANPGVLTNPQLFARAYTQALMAGAASAFWTWNALTQPPVVS